MVSSFHTHSMCEKVERVTAKTGYTSCTKRTISFEVSGFHTETRLLQRDFIFSEFMTLKMKSTTNELWKRWKMARYHHFIHIACARKYRGLWQKMDALRVQNRQSPSKYEGFIQKLVCYQGISLFWTYLNSRLFVCSKCTIQSQISNFQRFLTSFGLFRAFTHIF